MKGKKIVKIADKAVERAKKRNLEGTNMNSQNSFAVLGDNDIIRRTVCVGVSNYNYNFELIDNIRDLEIARHAIYMKNKYVLINDEETIPSMEDNIENIQLLD